MTVSRSSWRLSIASWMRSAYFSPTFSNSTEGIRTKRVRPAMCEKRVGFNQVSNDCRLIFFSSAPRILTQEFSTAAAVGTNDILRDLSFNDVLRYEPARACEGEREAASLASIRRIATAIAPRRNGKRQKSSLLSGKGECGLSHLGQKSSRQEVLPERRELNLNNRETSRTGGEAVLRNGFDTSRKSGAFSCGLARKCDSRVSCTRSGEDWEFGSASYAQDVG